MPAQKIGPYNHTNHYATNKDRTYIIGLNLISLNREHDDSLFNALARHDYQFQLIRIA